TRLQSAAGRNPRRGKDRVAQLRTCTTSRGRYLWRFRTRTNGARTQRDRLFGLSTRRSEKSVGPREPTQHRIHVPTAIRTRRAPAHSPFDPTDIRENRRSAPTVV